MDQSRHKGEKDSRKCGMEDGAAQLLYPTEREARRQQDGQTYQDDIPILCYCSAARPARGSGSRGPLLNTSNRPTQHMTILISTADLE